MNYSEYLQLYLYLPVEKTHTVKCYYKANLERRKQEASLISDLNQDCIDFDIDWIAHPVLFE
jgi:hypothetical protein